MLSALTTEALTAAVPYLDRLLVITAVAGLIGVTSQIYRPAAAAVLVVLGIAVGLRGAVWFVVESLRYQRSDLAWFRAWPRALLTGRFRWHGGHFDPGQRVANIAMLAALLTVNVTGARWRCCTAAPRSCGWCRCTAGRRTPSSHWSSATS